MGLLSLDQIQNLWPVALILVGLSDLFTDNADQASQPEPRREARRV